MLRICLDIYRSGEFYLPRSFDFLDTFMHVLHWDLYPSVDLLYLLKSEIFFICIHHMHFLVIYRYIMLLQILTLFLIVNNQEDSFIPIILLYFVGVFLFLFSWYYTPPTPPIIHRFSNVVKLWGKLAVLLLN